MKNIIHALIDRLPVPTKEFLQKTSLQINNARGNEGLAQVIKKIASGKTTVDIVISPNEISFAHGTGVLLSRLMENRNDFVAIRSRTDYGGEQRINAKEEFVLDSNTQNRREIFAQMSKWLESYDVRTILCAPYFETDLILAIAAQAITRAPLGLWIMDDNCLHNTGIKREVMSEAIDRSTALFAISPELKRAYQTEFGKAMSVLPPLVAASMIREKVSDVPTGNSLVMIGNLWSSALLKQLSVVIKESGLSVDWLSSNPDLWSSDISLETLSASGINVVDGSDPNKVLKALESAKCVIVPSDNGNAGPHEAALGNMSLPSRMTFIVASAGTPIIVVARPNTAAGAFVENLKIGKVVPYDGKALKSVFQHLSKPTTQKRIRKKSFLVSKGFSFAMAQDFIFQTILSDGRWPDNRFEKLMPNDPSAYGIHVDKPVPAIVAKSFGEVINFCDRLQSVGYEPDFILDVGASTAIWSHAVHSVFDKARYILCDPMFSRYPNIWTKPGFELIEAAISDKAGEATFSVSDDLYGSSLIRVSEVATIVDRVTVPLRTIDEIMTEKKVKGRGLMKVDVQYGEHLVIEGAVKSLKSSIDVVILELTLFRTHAQAKTLLEIANRMNTLGFRILDQVGGWRIPSTGEMEQLDVAFVRKDFALFSQDVVIQCAKQSSTSKKAKSSSLE